MQCLSRSGTCLLLRLSPYCLPSITLIKFKLKQLEAINLSLALPPVPKNLMQFQSGMVLATDNTGKQGVLACHIL